MKFKLLKRKGVLGLVCLFVFSFCAKPEEEKFEIVDLDVQYEEIKIQKASGELNLEKPDSVFEFHEYIIQILFRLSENTKNINGIISEFKSEKNLATLEFDTEVFRLNKRNLELKSKANNTLKLQSNLENGYYTDFDKEIDILESSINEFKIRMRRNQ